MITKMTGIAVLVVILSLRKESKIKSKRPHERYIKNVNNIKTKTVSCSKLLLFIKKKA